MLMNKRRPGRVPIIESRKEVANLTIETSTSLSDFKNPRLALGLTEITSMLGITNAHVLRPVPVPRHSQKDLVVEDADKKFFVVGRGLVIAEKMPEDNLKAETAIEKIEQQAAKLPASEIANLIARLSILITE